MKCVKFSQVTIVLRQFKAFHVFHDGEAFGSAVDPLTPLWAGKTGWQDPSFVVN